MGVGVGEQVKSDSTSLPGWSPVDALTSCNVARGYPVLGITAVAFNQVSTHGG